MIEEETEKRQKGEKRATYIVCFICLFYFFMITNKYEYNIIKNCSKFTKYINPTKKVSSPIDNSL